jgi:LysR family cyn operon transcriptional activator
MELRHLRYFVKSAELLHFTRAAHALNVSQPTLSIQIQQLEEELGSQLFERIGRTVRLTPAGQLFLDNARRAILHIEAGQQSLYDLQGLLRGTLRIGATAPFGAELLPNILAEFLRLHPGVQLHLTKAATHRIQDGLKSGLFDLGLVYQSSDPSHDFSSRELCKVEIVAVTCKSHALAKSKKLRLKDLAQIPLALPAAEFATRQVTDAAFADNKIQPHIILETNDIDALLKIVRKGIAATLLPRPVTQGFADLIKIPLDERSLLWTAAFVWPKEVELSAAAQRFLQLAEDMLKPTEVRKSVRRRINRR